MKSAIQKKILIVAESIDVEDSSGSKANVALILNLSEVGFEILVYHYTRKEIQLPNISCIKIKEKKFNFIYLLSRLQRKIQHGLHINLAKYLEPIFGFSFTFFNDVKSIAAALKAEKSFKQDLVLTLSKGASYRPHYALLKVPKLHHQWMAYMHDPYPFCFYPEPYTWCEPGYRKKIEFFNRVSEKCKWTAFPSLLLAEWMEKHFASFKNKRLIIPHQLNPGIIETEDTKLPDYFDLKKFNLLHAGNLMKQRDPFPLIKAFQKFISCNPDADKVSRLLLIGNASYHHEKLKEQEDKIKQLYVSDGYINYKDSLELQKRASINIVLESKADFSPFLPGKFPQCISANKPILYLGPAKSEVKRLLGADYAYSSETNNIDKIAEIIENLYVQWQKDPTTLKLHRDDLIDYVSSPTLKKVFQKI